MKYKLYGFIDNEWLEYATYEDVLTLVSTANLLGQEGYDVKVEVIK